MMKSKLQPVYIEWCDAISFTQKTWVDIENAIEWAESNNWIVSEVGFIIEENKRYILLCSKVSKELDEVGLLMKIPKTWILKRVNLNIK